MRVSLKPPPFKILIWEQVRSLVVRGEDVASTGVYKSMRFNLKKQNLIFSATYTCFQISAKVLSVIRRQHSSYLLSLQIVSNLC